MAMVYNFDKQVELAGDTEEMKKPLLSKERLINWRTSFKSGYVMDMD